MHAESSARISEKCKLLQFSVVICEAPPQSWPFIMRTLATALVTSEATFLLSPTIAGVESGEQIEVSNPTKRAISSTRR
jgi:hypothetical protein